MYIRSILAAGLLALAAAGALAATDNRGATPARPDESLHDGRHAPRGFGASVEGVALHNIMASLIAARTGRPEADIRALFENNRPRDAIDKLGLSRDDVHALMKQAHTQLIDKVAAAGLITADQAAKLHAQRMPRDHDAPPAD